MGRHTALGVASTLALLLATAGVLVSARPAAAMPSTILSFRAMGTTNTPTVVTGSPSDANGAAGPNGYVEVVNGGIEVFNKSGGVILAAKPVNTLWTGYLGYNAGNGCATRNDGDPMVRYDQLADRWLIAQISIPHSGLTSPFFECVAVSRTGDPTGAYWLYDFQYNAAAPGLPSIGVWPDAYYYATNFASSSGYLGPELCAWNRAAMQAGQASGATQQCFLLSTNYGSLLPADLDASVPPPPGSPEYVVAEDLTAGKLDVWKFHVDWTTPGNSTLSGPTVLTTFAYTDACITVPACVPQLGTTNKVQALGGQVMDRAAYRNFGTHESLVVNLTVQGSSSNTATGWFEIRFPSGTPTIFQQGVYNPPDARFRWNGSIAQDAAGDMVIGFSEASSLMYPAIAWTGRLSSDPLGTMAQPEAILVSGAGSETGTDRWGDFSSMSVDPTDDCTFWFTNEYYAANGSTTWDTQVSSTRFPNCRANDFSVSAASLVGSFAPGMSGATTVNTTLTKGAAEALTLTASGLPGGTTASFIPATVTAGNNSELTFNVGPSTPPGLYPILVVATAASAYHSAWLTLNVLPAVAVLPAMANAAYGGYTTVSEIQNVGGGHADVAIEYFDSTGAQVGNGETVVSLPPHATWTLRQDNGHAFVAGGAGSARIFSNQPIASFVNEFAPVGGDATSYTGISLASGAGTTLYAPAIANSAYGGYTTGIGLVNAGSTAADVTITYHDANGAVVKTQTIPAVPAGAYQGLYSGDLTLALPNGFAGTATITSSSGPLAAIVNETGPGGQFSSYDAVPAGGTTLYAPAALNNAYGGYFTGMGIQNTTNTAGTVTITYYDSTGTPTVTTHPVPANGYLGVYQGTDIPAVGAYTAKITSNVGVTAIVNEVAPSVTSAKQSTAYNTFASGSGTLNLPLVESNSIDGWATGEGIMNTGTAPTTVTVTYHDIYSGLSLGTPDLLVLQPNAFWGLYQPSGGLPSGTRASAVVTTTAGGQVAVICNESNATTFMSYSGQ